jgi:hypothetical protein
MKNTTLTITAFICFAMSGIQAVNATDRIINVSQDSSGVSVIKPSNQADKGSTIKYIENKTSDDNWIDSLFSGGDEEKPINRTLDSDEQNILLNKEYLDPDEHIVKSKKRWEQSLNKKLPDSIAEPYVFFNTKPGLALSSRMYIDEREGKIYFLVKQGSLKRNINSLMDETRNTKHLIWKVGNHKVFSEYWVSGNSMFEVINNVLMPYKQPDQVMFGVFLGNTIGIFYRGDKEFWL